MVGVSALKTRGPLGRPRPGLTALREGRSSVSLVLFIILNNYNHCILTLELRSLENSTRYGTIRTREEECFVRNIGGITIKAHNLSHPPCQGSVLDRARSPGKPLVRVDVGGEVDPRSY